MSIYDKISSIYDQIFPVNPLAVQTIESLVPKNAEKRILDLGAATGGHARAFADRGWDTLGIELNSAMARTAAEKAHVVEGSMLDAESIVKSDYGLPVRFGAIVCLGNTLPHVSPEAIPALFSSVKRMLHSGSPFVIQALNYAHPNIKPGFEFPVIATDSFTFERRYEQGDQPETIRFMTTVSLKDETYRDAMILYTLKPEMLTYWLHGAGFKNVELWAGWDRIPFREEADRYIVVVAK